VPSGVTLAACSADIVELVALRERVHVLRALAARRGVSLPLPGRLTATAGTLVMCVRPERWLLLSPPRSPGTAAAAWQVGCGGCGVAVDLSSAFAMLQLAGTEVRTLLTRGCRIDLDPDVFPEGQVAATMIAQVAVMLAAIPGGMLLLTPASTARHLREWLAAAARPFGFALHADISVAALCGDSHS
jgi:sarcosine oxidase subunit gamma